MKEEILKQFLSLLILVLSVSASYAQWDMDRGQGYTYTPVNIGHKDGVAKFHLKGGFLVEPVKAIPPSHGADNWDLGLDYAHDFGKTAGNKFYWSPQNLAFRVGQTYDDNWANVNSGFLSIAFGDGIAFGDYSFIQGSHNTAFDQFSIAMGRNNNAGTKFKNRLGVSIAIGSDNTASNDGSLALGHHVQAHGAYAMGLGYAARASGSNSIAIGTAYAAGTRSLAIGHTSGSTFESPMALGDGSFAIGIGTLINDVPNSLMIGFNNSATKSENGLQTLPTLFVGSSDVLGQVKPFGFVGIGTKTPQSELSVNGKITAKELELTMVGWPDYVFANDYKMTSLEETEKYISEHKHLPGVPSAKEVEQNGLNVGNMNKIMMEKIEELTLHLIDQNKKMDSIMKENESLKKLVGTLQNK